jgi:hypothetical protein
MATHPRYRVEGGTHCIDVRLNAIEQLFDNRDPAPFRERDLDPDLVEYLYAAGEDLISHGPLKVVFWVTSPCQPTEVETAYRAHFEYELLRLERRQRRHWRTGQVALLLGVAMLVLMVSASELLAGVQYRLVKALREGLVILSWVVMWRPVEILLYDWVPVRRERKVMERLHRVQVEVRAESGPAAE